MKLLLNFWNCLLNISWCHYLYNKIVSLNKINKIRKKTKLECEPSKLVEDNSSEWLILVHMANRTMTVWDQNSTSKENNPKTNEKNSTK